jgi:hypothetical protein
MASADYSKMTHTDFENCLFELLSEYSAKDLILLIPNLSSEIMEYFNNDVLELWLSKQPYLDDIEDSTELGTEDPEDSEDIMEKLRRYDATEDNED